MTNGQIYENNKMIAEFMKPPTPNMFVPKGWQILYPSYHTNWNELMPVCKKIIDMYKDNRQDIFSGLTSCDIDATYQAVIAFINFWFDENQPKHVWSNVAFPYDPVPKGKFIGKTYNK